MAVKETLFRQDLTARAEQSAKLPAISFSRAPLTSAHTFYRSRILTTEIDINPLIAAAAALFPLLHKLTETKHYENLDELQQMLVHEIKAFEIKAQNMECRTEKILIARFILCSAIDEAILNTSWGKNQWERYKLLITFHHESWGGEHFFLILERLAENIPLNIDLLELIYICFSFGYQGKYRIINNGKEQLANLVDELYQQIKWQRGELRKNLLINDNCLIQQQETDTQQMPLWLILSFFFSIILTCYMSFNFLLSEQANALYQQLNHLLILLN